MSRKLKISELKVKSFVTGFESQNEGTVKGGRWSIIHCPHTGSDTMDAIGCNSLDDFYCGQQSLGGNCDGDDFFG